MDNLSKLKMNIREAQTPFFTEEELEYYLEKNDNDVEKASYECLIIKAETTGLSVSGLTTKDSSSYFKMLASNFIETNSGVLS
jgi:hypothetical protein